MSAPQSNSENNKGTTKIKRANHVTYSFWWKSEPIIDNLSLQGEYHNSPPPIFLKFSLSDFPSDLPICYGSTAEKLLLCLVLRAIFSTTVKMNFGSKFRVWVPLHTTILKFWKLKKNRWRIDAVIRYSPPWLV